MNRRDQISQYWVDGGPVVCSQGMTWPHHAVQKARKEVGLPELRAARFDTRCVVCHSLIPEGEYSYWDRRSSNYCQKCA